MPILRNLILNLDLIKPESYKRSSNNNDSPVFEVSVKLARCAWVERGAHE